MAKVILFFYVAEDIC